MKTDFLKGLGLDEAAISKVMAENGKDVEVEKAKYTSLEIKFNTAKAAYGKFKANSIEAKFLESDKNTLAHIRDIWAEALSEAAEASKAFAAEGKKNNTDNGVQYSFNEQLYEQLEDWKFGKGKAYGSYNGHYLNLGTTPNILIKHGAPNAELIMYEDCLLKVTGGKHSISTDELAKLPAQLNDPILLFKGSVPDSFVALTELIDEHGNDVIVLVHINNRKSRSVVNKITSVYSKSDELGNNHIKKYSSSQIESGNLLDASSKKASNWFTSRGLQLPKLVQTILDANSRLSQDNSAVNTIISENSKNDTDNNPHSDRDYEKPITTIFNLKVRMN